MQLWHIARPLKRSATRMNSADHGGNASASVAHPVSVLYVINGLGTGGAERSLLELVPALQVRAVSVSIATLYRRDVGVEAHFRSQGWAVHNVGGERLIPDRLTGLRRLIRSERPDIVHTSIFEADVLGRLGAIGTGTRVLTSLVNTSYDPIRLRDSHVRRNRLAAARLIDGWTARHLTHHFHAISHAVKEASVAALGISPHQVTVIPRGRDPERLGARHHSRRERVRRSLGVADDATVILNVGRQEYQKGQEHLLEAMAELHHRPNVVLLIAGRDGAATSTLQRRKAALGLNGRVRFLGHRDDVPDLLAAADIFAFPSLYEGQGGAVLEAMAMSVPVIASDIPALREVVESGVTGLLVPRGDAKQLVAAISSLLDDDRYRATMGIRGRDVFEHRYVLSAAADRMARLYHRLAGNCE